MDKIAEFITEVHSIDVSLEKRYLVENMYPLKEEDVPKEAKKHLKSKELYVVNKCNEGTIRTLYNKAKFSLASLSDKELENTLKLLKDYGYEHFDKAYRTYYMKLTNGEAHPKHDTYFMLALESRFKNDVPHFGVFTMEFLHDLMDDVGIKRGYLFSLTQDVKKMMGKNDKKITPQSTTAVSSLQSEPHSPHPKTSSSIDNNDKPINYNPMDINFEAIFEVALNYADDPEEMKEFCMREQRKAEKEHEYIDKSFYKGLLKVVADKKERAKYQPKPGPTPTHIGSFFIAGGGGSGYDYKSIELLEQIIEELRDEGSVQRIEQTNKNKHENNAILSPEIKPLFNFIDFLHANIENFNQYDNVLLELNEMFERFFQLGFHIEEIIERKALQKEIDSKWNIITDNIVTPIKDKAAELNLFDWSAPETLSNNYFEIANTLSKTCKKKDFDAIYYAKRQYIEFTNKISPNVISNVTKEAQSMFEFMNKMMFEIAKNFSKEGDKPIKKIEAKQVDDIQKEIESYKSGEIASLPLNITNSNTVSTQSNLDETQSNPIIISEHLPKKFNNTVREEQTTPLKTTVEEKTKQPLYTPKPQKHLSKHYALSFMFDCLATGTDFTLYDSKKSDLEAIGKSRVNGAISGNTFYKAFNKIMSEKINLECKRDLFYIAGDNWRDIIIELSHKPEEVVKFLEEKEL